MPRFIKETDYTGRIAPEIKQFVTATTGSSPSPAQVRAEDTAISTITEYIGGRYDCTLIFTPNTTDPDTRNLHIVNCVIILTLYDLYHQTGMRDIPQHRKDEYDDMIMWLKDVGRGTIKCTLPPLSDSAYVGEISINSRPPRRNRW